MKSSLWDNTKAGTEFRISTREMDSIVNDFTLTRRSWPTYSADRIETMARWANKIPINAWYVCFDPDREELIFRIAPGIELPPQRYKTTVTDLIRKLARKLGLRLLGVRRKL